MKTQVNRWARGAVALLLTLLVVGGGFFVTALAFADDVEGADVEVQSDSGPIAKVTVGSTNTEYYDLKMALEDWERAESNSTLFILREVTDTDLAGVRTAQGAITIPFDDYASGVRKTLDLNGYELNASLVVNTHCRNVYNNGYSPLEFVLSSGTLTGGLRVTNDWIGNHNFHGGGVNVSLAGGANVYGGVSIPETNYESYYEEGYANSLIMAADCGTVGGVYIGTKSTFTMHGGTITNGEDGKIDELEGRGVVLGQYATFTMNAGTITGNTAKKSDQSDVAPNGGGVFLGYYATFTMNDGTITGNTALTNGGGVCAEPNAVITMAAGTISDNQAVNGGGVYAEGPAWSEEDSPRAKTFTMTGGTISGNTATGIAGGVYVKGQEYKTSIYWGNFSVTGGEISNNSAVDGGGVYVGPWGSFTMSESTISGNTAASASEGGSANGGGVYVDSNAAFTMQSGTIGGEAGNRATNGGGVFVRAYGKFIMGDGTISNNSATGNGGGAYVAGGSYDFDHDYSTAFEMSGGTITNNEATGNGGGVWFSGGGKYDTAYYGKFTMAPGAIVGNTAANGGGVYVAGGQYVLSNGGYIGGNKAEAASTEAPAGQEDSPETAAAGGNGGGVYVAGAASQNAVNGEFYMSGNGGAIASNTATGNGGGVYVAGAATEGVAGGVFVMRGTIGGTTKDADGKEQSAGNTATDGGGVYVAGGATDNAAGGRFVMGAGGAGGDNITNNTAKGNGGGVYLAGGATDSASTECGGWLTMSAGTITGNTATTKGGGVYVASSNTFIISGALNITENTANGKANNVHLYQAQSNTVNTMKVDGLLAGSQIGVSIDYEPTKDDPAVLITEGYDDQGDQQNIDPNSYFINDVKASDDGTQKYFVCWLNGHESGGNMDAAIHLHVHNWMYKENQTSGTLTATCNALGYQHGACLDPTNTQQITLTRTLSVPAATKTYDGKEVTATLSKEDLWTEANGLQDPQISYYKADDLENALSGAPKDAGSYVAKATVTVPKANVFESQTDGNVTATIAQVSFTINPLEATLSWADTSLTYNGKEQKPTATVSNLVKGDTCTVTVTGEKTTVGTYQAEATELSNANYVLPSEKTTSFTINPLEAKLAWANTSFVYDGMGHMPTATVSNLASGDTCVVTVTGEQTKAGTHKATATKLSNENYKLPADPTTQFTIASTSVSYGAHVQTYGDRGPVTSGMVGTEGESKRMEAITARVAKGSIEYRSHVQGKGWEKTWAKDGGVSGTIGEAKRVEAIQMKISGAEGQHVWYRVHSQTYGTLGWAKDGEPAGTAGQSKRLEAYEVVVLPDGQTPKGYDASVPAFRSQVQGMSHVQGIGWQPVAPVGLTGTTGQSKRIEAINLTVPAALTDVYAGGIEYQLHLQGKGWQGFRKGGVMAGTVGESRRAEAVQIKLTGELAEHFSVWYRVHSQSFGWSGWTRDGRSAGSGGYGKRAEAIEVVILPYTAAAPGSTANAYRSK